MSLTITDHPLFGVTLTVAAYAAAQLVSARWPRLHPLFLTSGALIVFLLASGIPYESYKIGGDVVAFFLGPATVALGVPIYKNARHIGKAMVPILLGIGIGSIVGVGGSWLLVTLCHGSREVLLAMLPRSVTSPIAIEITRQFGGSPQLAAVFAVLSGLMGSMFGPAFLRRCGIRDEIAVGTAIGTASHGIGTARILRESELMGSVGGFAMGVTGIVTSLAVIPLYHWL